MKSIWFYRGRGSLYGMAKIYIFLKSKANKKLRG